MTSKTKTAALRRIFGRFHRVHRHRQRVRAGRSIIVLNQNDRHPQRASQTRNRPVPVRDELPRCDHCREITWF